ncbi:MAG TPA: DNA polymerase Y family protein [Stellaceae bacterium]|nr:DNA polymerase Y family protein [Stellaceae bacterium]
MARVVSIWLPNWATDRLRRSKRRSALAASDRVAWNRPLATVTRDGRRRILAAVDDAARALGLVPGMDVAHAQALVGDLALVPAVPESDATGLALLGDWCHRFGPIVAVDAPDGLLFDAGGLAHLYGGEDRLLEVLEARLSALGLAVRLGLADTVGAAWAWARFGPAGIIESCAQHAALASLPVAGLRIEAAIAKRLGQLGFGRIGQLYTLPRASLTRRFGPHLVTRLDQALGAVEEPVAPLTPVEDPNLCLGFAEPIATPEDLTRAIHHLCAGLCRMLAEHGLGARRLLLVCHRVDGVNGRIGIGTVRANRDAGHLARLLLERLDTIDPGFGIEAMRLIATRTDLQAPEQLGTLHANHSDGGDGGGDAELDMLVDRLIGRLGAAHVYRMQPVESDWPEHAMHRVAPMAETYAAALPVLPRPVRLLAYPEPVETTALMPDHPPAQFIWHGIRHKVVHADGPERLTPEWWRGGKDRAERDYFQVEDESGRRFWLFRQDRAWFLHGFFA